jgi:hypothetical protein
LAGDILKSFGDLNCIFSLGRGNKSNSIVDVEEESLDGRPPIDFDSVEQSLECSLEMVLAWTPVIEEI